MILSDYKRRSPAPVKVGNITYSNPRGLPENWVKNYLERDRSLLALDVMRVFDEKWKLERKLARAQIVGVYSGVLLAVWEVVKFLLEHHR
jgi:hypothetical protein